MKTRVRAPAAFLMSSFLAAALPAKAQVGSPWDEKDRFVRKCSNSELADAGKAAPQSEAPSVVVVKYKEMAERAPTEKEARDDSDLLLSEERARIGRAQKIADLLLAGDKDGAAEAAKSIAAKLAADGGRAATARDVASSEQIARALVALAGIESDQELFYYLHGRFSKSICELAAASPSRDPHLYVQSMTNILDGGFGIRIEPNPNGYQIYARARDEGRTRIYFRGPPKKSPETDAKAAAL